MRKTNGYKLESPAVWLIKPDGGKIKIVDHKVYDARDIRGCYCEHPVIVTHIPTGAKKRFNPKQKIFIRIKK